MSLSGGAARIESWNHSTVALILAAPPGHRARASGATVVARNHDPIHPQSVCFSIVSPAYNEAENLEPLIEEVGRAGEAVFALVEGGGAFEFILVDAHRRTRVHRLRCGSIFFPGRGREQSNTFPPEPEHGPTV